MTDRTAWCAGFFDGEGTIALYTANDGYTRLRIAVYQRVLEPVEVYVELWGGKVTQNTNSMYQWQAVGKRAGQALVDMLPYLVVKKPQAELALQFLELSKQFVRHPDFATMIQEMKDLKRPWLKVVND